MTPNHRTGRWVLPFALVLGLGVGIGIGLSYAWIVDPVDYTDVAPDSLYPLHREEYIVLIGQTYAYDHDLAAAQARLAGLGDLVTMGSEVATLAERLQAQRGNPAYIQALARLAFALGHERVALATYVPGATVIATWTPPPTATPTVPTETPTAVPTSTPTVPTATATPEPTATPTLTPRPESTRPQPTPTQTRRPTRTPRPTATAVATRTPTPPATPMPRYQVVEQRRACDIRGGQLMVMVLDAEGQPQPSIELLVRWDGQDDHFFTGLKPEIGPGYADFGLTKGQTYQVMVIGAESQVAQGIVADTCEGQGYLASWQIIFQWNGQAP